MKKGYLQIYTGNGKGKTTAAIGLAVRAAGAGKKVRIIQFAKGRLSSEFALLLQSTNITFSRFGTTKFIKGDPSPADKRHAQNGFTEALAAFTDKKLDLLILDEFCCAVGLGMITLEDALLLIASRPDYLELVITGRNAHPALIKKADLVSEIKEIRHYFRNGVAARKGIEY